MASDKPERCPRCGKGAGGSPFHTCDSTLWANGVNEAIAAAEKYISLMGPTMTVAGLIAAMREHTGVLP